MPGLFNNLLCCRNNNAVVNQFHEPPPAVNQVWHAENFHAAPQPPVYVPQPPVYVPQPHVAPVAPQMPMTRPQSNDPDHAIDFLLRRAEESIRNFYTLRADTPPEMRRPMPFGPTGHEELAVRLGSAHTTALEKIQLCRELVSKLAIYQELEFNGSARRVDFFASYGIDLALVEIGRQYTARLDDDFHHLLSQWSEIICPTQTEFNLNGVVYTKDEVQQMLRDRNLFQRGGTVEPNDAMIEEMEELMHDDNYYRQSVHTTVVREAGTQIYRTMIAKVNQIGSLGEPRKTIREVRRFINANLMGTQRTQTLAGLNIVETRQGTDSLWEIQTTPNELLNVVWSYIKTTESNPEINQGLKYSLTSRLEEIHREGPCMVGILQRLIDTPSGIDPEMNSFAKMNDLQNNLTHLAATVNERFAALVDEDAETRRTFEETTHEDQTVSELGRTMLNQRADLELHVARGLSTSQYAPQLRQLEEGF